MPRTRRQESSTGYYHVVMRGNKKSWIFKKDEYKHEILEILKGYETDGMLELAAWCIMDNHVHLVVKTELDQLSLAMKKLNIKFAMRYNLKENTSGHVFQDRFKSQAIESDEYLLQVIRYVHNNPVKAGIVEKAKDYKWSSYGTYLEEYFVGGKGQMQLIMGFFKNDIKEFAEFHDIKDDNEYLEIKEDRQKHREEKVQHIISECCNKYGLSEVHQIRSHKILMNELILELVDKSGMSYRAIARLLKINYNTVRDVSKGGK